MPYISAEKVEAAVQGIWSAMTFSPELVELVTETVDQEFQKQKVIDAYLAEALPLEDLKVRQAGIQVELVATRQLIKQAFRSLRPCAA